MSPASKSKDKVGVRAVKEQPKVSSKPSPVPSNGGNSAPASAYNPVSGTFHTLETAPYLSLPTPQSNGQFRTIDETEEHSGSSLGTAAEYDSVSNNDSCSGESVEEQKEKETTSTVPRTDSIPVPGSDTDKRDKIRQKNERKHQRQREKRSQELHDRCSGYLMSRKLEALTQHLVAMGFPSERATMALILNEGRMEESVAWLLHDEGEENKEQVTTNLEGGSGVHLKIDITNELARIVDMEIKYKCTKQEVERAVVSCEGDLVKAEDTLKTHKQELAVAATSKLEESGDLTNGLLNSKVVTSSKNPMARSQVKGVASVSNQQQQRDERDFIYTKAGVVTGAMLQESSNSNLQSLSRLQPNKPEWAPSSEKRWLTTSSSPPPSHSLASPLQVAVPPAKSESQYAILGREVVKTSLQAGALREPVIVMQRSQSIINANKQSLSSTSSGISVSPPVSAGWYSSRISNSMEMMTANGGLGHNLPSMGLNGGGSSSQQFYPQNHLQPFVSSPVESGATGWRSGSWNTMGSSLSSPSVSSLAAPSSLGLFTSWGSGGSSSGSSSHVDWNSGWSMSQRDYTRIDWSLDLTPLRPSVKSDTWSTMFMGGKAAMGPVMNGGGVYIPGLQDSSSRLVTANPSSGVSPEWSSPFAGKDIFGVPRQFVSFPSL